MGKTNKERYTAAEVAQALTKTKGMMFLAAQRLKCSQETVRLYCKRYPSVQAARDAQRGIMVDTAEVKLLKAIEDDQAWAIAFCLKTIGKDRGYVERQEHTGNEGNAIVLRVVYENAVEAEEPVVLEMHVNGHRNGEM